MGIAGEKRQPPSPRRYGGAGWRSPKPAARGWGLRGLGEAVHLLPPFATWYRAFNNKNIFRSVSGRLAKGWPEEPKDRLNTHKYICVHLDTHAKNFFDMKRTMEDDREAKQPCVAPSGLVDKLPLTQGDARGLAKPWAEIQWPYRPEKDKRPTQERDGLRPSRRAGCPAGQAGRPDQPGIGYIFTIALARGFSLVRVGKPFWKSTAVGGFLFLDESHKFIDQICENF